MQVKSQWIQPDTRGKYLQSAYFHEPRLSPSPMPTPRSGVSTGGAQPNVDEAIHTAPHEVDELLDR
ncbi:hypothetical protein Asppvi_007082 [Aspergillus pseudoviridinutans]|uniref:Uncharacterized protein n=1 Tax=Aspergillus pseudoviridinutans TaxID=1517512 RepID=A0A9P3EWU6_9EURO|nr:uncharacterized protein Asppvi_007082 [Aspergillus pseudoviridinutans]GIJ88165.1 hypothetical protein Asppvi_007082 [Aspergillus pseudoviridinutans]